MYIVNAWLDMCLFGLDMWPFISKWQVVDTIFHTVYQMKYKHFNFELMFKVVQMLSSQNLTKNDNQWVFCFVVSAVHFALYLTGLSSIMLIWSAVARCKWRAHLPQQDAVAEAWTADLLILWQAVYHWATLPPVVTWKCRILIKYRNSRLYKNRTQFRQLCSMFVCENKEL